MSVTGNNDDGSRDVRLSRELQDFVKESCDANVRVGILTLQNLSVGRENAEKVVTIIEMSRALKRAVEEGT